MGGVFFGWLLAEGAVPGAETMLGGTFMLAGLAVVLIGGEARQKRLASLEVTAEGAHSTRGSTSDSLAVGVVASPAREMNASASDCNHASQSTAPLRQSRGLLIASRWLTPVVRWHRRLRDDSARDRRSTRAANEV